MRCRRSLAAGSAPFISAPETSVALRLVGQIFVQAAAGLLQRQQKAQIVFGQCDRGLREEKDVAFFQLPAPDDALVLQTGP